MKSIFEVEHLRSTAIFLDTQCKMPIIFLAYLIDMGTIDRMPPLIGEVVSDHIYNSQLCSNPDHPVPISETCCWFVHVEESEEKREAPSWHVSRLLL